MVDMAMAQAGMQFPVLGFPSDGDVMPFEGMGLLAGKMGWLAGQGRHLGLEIVDSTERRWIVSGLVSLEPPKKRWWQFGRSADMDEPLSDIALREIEPQPFPATRARVEAEAASLFDESDEALAAIRAAATMAELSEACFQITLRGQGRRILSGDAGVAIRSASDVASRALLLFAAVRVALRVDRVTIVEWLVDHDLHQAMTPDESDLFTKIRLSDQRRAEAGWEMERLTALLWALGLVTMSPDGEDPDISTIVELVPPTGALSLERFLASELKPARELAAMAERYREILQAASEDHARDSSDEAAARVESAGRRYTALQWVINPDRIDWG